MAPKVDPVPRVDWSGAWTTLRGYIQEAILEGKPLNPVEVAAYMDELRHTTLKPIGAWIAATIEAAEQDHEGESSC